MRPRRKIPAAAASSQPILKSRDVDASDESEPGEEADYWLMDGGDDDDDDDDGEQSKSPHGNF